MRVTMPLKYDRTVSNMNRLNSQLSQLSAQVTTGKRISKPADDPLGWARSMSIKSGLQDISRFQSNIDYAVHWNRATDNALSQLTELFISANETAVAAMGIPLNDADTAYQQKLDEIFEQALGIVNDRHANRYLFAVNSDVPPFSLSADGQVLLHGPQDTLDADNSFSVRISHGLVQEAGLDSRSLFYVGELEDPVNIFSGEVVDEGPNVFSAEELPQQGLTGLLTINVNGYEVHFDAGNDEMETSANFVDAVENHESLKNIGITASLDLDHKIILDAEDGRSINLTSSNITSADLGFAQNSKPSVAGNTVTAGESGLSYNFKINDVTVYFEDGDPEPTTRTTAEAIAAAVNGNEALKAAGITASVGGVNEDELSFSAADGRAIVLSEGEDGVGAHGRTLTELGFTGSSHATTRGAAREGEVSNEIEPVAPVAQGPVDGRFIINGVELTVDTSQANPADRADAVASAVNGHAVLTAAGIRAEADGGQVTFVAEDGRRILIEAGTENDISGNLGLQTLDKAATTLCRESKIMNSLTAAQSTLPISSGDIYINGCKVEFTGGNDALSTALGFVDAVNSHEELESAGIRASTEVDPDSPHYLRITLSAADGRAVNLTSGTTNVSALGFTEETRKSSMFEPSILGVIQDLKQAISERDSDKITQQMVHIDKILENINRQATLTGNRLDTLDARQYALDMLSLEEQTRLADVEDADLFAAVADLQIKTTTFDAALKVTGMLSGLNLLQYV